MSFLTDLLERLRSLLFRERDEREMNEELDFHLEMEAESLHQTGLEASEARRQARIGLGGRAQIQEEIRDARGTRLLDQLRQDVRYAFRSLGQNRGFAVVSLLILGLGIGANAAMFSLVDALLLRSLPVEDPAGLVIVGNPNRPNAIAEGGPRADVVSFPVYADVRAGTKTLASLYATGRTGQLDLQAPGDGSGTAPDHPQGRFVSGSFFSVLGIPALHGRTLDESDDRGPGSGPVVVLSHGYWQRRFGGDPTVIGRSVTVNGAPLTVIGIAPAGFTGDVVGQPQDLWLPLTMQPIVMVNRDWLADRSTSWLLLMGRRKPGVSLAQARSELTELVRRSLMDNVTVESRPALDRHLADGGLEASAGARGFSDFRGALGSTLALLMAAVALVLLVVTANVANLMLARGAARAREMSIRLSLGASRRRVVIQLLTEASLLALGGVALGMALARIGTGVLLQLAGSGRTLALAVPLDGRVVGFTSAIALLAVLMFGLVPALRMTRVEIATVLRASGRSLTGGSGRLRLNRALVIAQVALSTLLLVGTGMIVRSLGHLTDADLGLDRDRIVVASIDAARVGGEGARLAALRRDLVERIRRVPGVEGVSYSENGLFNGTESGGRVDLSGYTPGGEPDRYVRYDVVGPDYFTTIGARLLEGRDFSEKDGEAGAKVAVINRTMAGFYFPTRAPIGQTVTLDENTYQIVGVVDDIKGHQVRSTPERRLYVGMEQVPVPVTEFVFEVRGAEPTRLAQPVRDALVAANPDLVRKVVPLSDLVRNSLQQDRMATLVITGFGVLALFLAGLGLYGVMAYSTLRRSGEFGLRMALGAQRGDVTRLVVGEALRLVAFGTVAGVPAALIAARIFRSQWFGIEPIDPPAIAVALATMLISAVLAAYLPAVRASRVPPLRTLRAE